MVRTFESIAKYTMDFVQYNVSLSKCLGEISEEIPSLTVKNWENAKRWKTSFEQLYLKSTFHRRNCSVLIRHVKETKHKECCGKRGELGLLLVAFLRPRWRFWLAHLHLHVSSVLFATRSWDHLDSTLSTSRVTVVRYKLRFNRFCWNCCWLDWRLLIRFYQ